MSNIHTFSEIKERTENNRPLPSSWADSRQISLETDEEAYGNLSTNIGGAFIDMNGEVQAIPPGAHGQTCLYSCAPCCVEPCGQQRRSEYTKSLKSLSVPLILVQILLLIVTLCLHGFAPPSQNWTLGPPAKSLLTMGAKLGYLIQKGAVWRMVTAMFLHVGIVHLLLNMLTLWRMGLFLERRWGTARYSAVYFASGIGGTLLSCLIRPDKISVGASGALSGLMGAFLGDILVNYYNMPTAQRKILLFQALFWASLTILLGFLPNIDIGAHLGGLVVGFGVGVIINSHVPKTQFYRILAISIPAGLLFIYFLVGIICFWTVVKCTPYIM